MALRTLRSQWRYGNLAGDCLDRFLNCSGGIKGWEAGPDFSLERIQVACFFKQANLNCSGRFAVNARSVGHPSFVGVERGRECPSRRYGISAEGGFQICSHLRYFSGVSWQDTNQAPRLLVVQPRIHPVPVLKAKLLEALRLADSLEDSRQQQLDRSRNQKKQLLPPYVLVQSPSSSGRSSSSKRLQARAYFGAGTIDIVRAHIDETSQGRIDAVFVNVPLSGVQQRNLEDAWGKPVFDRVSLIIEIFGAHAKTKAARLQVELASLYYKRSRLVRARGTSGARLGFGAGGESQVVSARGRATGSIGGAGETEIQLQRRRVGERQHRLKLLLAEVDRTQSLHRAARQRQGQYAADHGSRLPVVAVVGYTNAGKSSLVAALSQSSLYIDDKLFATLDTRSRRVVLPSGQKVILSDTVGCISDLPTQLVKAFQSTLDEVVEADYLLHVIDSSAPNASEQREAVLRVLEEIGTPKHNLENCLIEVWNKADLAGGGHELGRAVGLEGNMNSSELNHNGQISSQEDVLIVDTDHEVSHLIQAVNVGENPTEDGTEILGVEWCTEGVSCVATSARTKMGLKELCHLLDRKLPREVGRQSDVEVEESF